MDLLELPLIKLANKISAGIFKAVRTTRVESKKLNKYYTVHFLHICTPIILNIELIKSR